MDCNCNEHSDYVDTHTDGSGTFHHDAPLPTYEQGWEDAVKKLADILKIWGEAACVLLDFMPSKELTLPWRVSDECVLEFTVKKK